MTDVLDHPWLGGLFGDAEAAALWSPERQIAHMLAFEASLLRARGAVGAMPAERAERAARRVESATIAPNELRAGTARDGVPVPALVARLRDLAGEDDASHVHAGATSQDVLDTALALTLKETAALADRRLEELVAALARLEARDGDRVILGRTRMQAALPIRAATRIAAWRHPLERHRDRLRDAAEAAACLQLGGPVGDRKSLGPEADALAAHMAASLGLADAPCWHAARDGPIALAGALANVCASLGKIGLDIGLMTQQGIDAATLAAGGGSSAMAHKRNPVRAEILVALARHAAQLSAGMLQAGLHEQERSGAAWALEWLTLPTLSRTTLRALAMTREVVDDLRIQPLATGAKEPR